MQIRAFSAQLQTVKTTMLSRISVLLKQFRLVLTRLIRQFVSAQTARAVSLNATASNLIRIKYPQPKAVEGALYVKESG